MADKAFDAHCHLFTLEYLLRELLAILDSAVQKQYPVYPQPSFLTAASQDHRGFFQKLTDTIGSIAGLCEVLAESCAQHLAKDCAGYSAHQADDLITLPLMMDIFYIFRHGDVADTDQGATFTELANSLIAPLLAQVPAALKPVVKQKMLDLIEEFSTKTHPSPLAALTLSRRAGTGHHLQFIQYEPWHDQPPVQESRMHDRQDPPVNHRIQIQHHRLPGRGILAESHVGNDEREIIAVAPQ